MIYIQRFFSKFKKNAVLKISLLHIRYQIKINLSQLHHPAFVIQFLGAFIFERIIVFSVARAQFLFSVAQQRFYFHGMVQECPWYSRNTEYLTKSDMLDDIRQKNQMGV